MKKIFTTLSIVLMASFLLNGIFAVPHSTMQLPGKTVLYHLYYGQSVSIELFSDLNATEEVMVNNVEYNLTPYHEITLKRLPELVSVTAPKGNLLLKVVINQNYTLKYIYEFAGGIGVLILILLRIRTRIPRMRNRVSD